MSKYKLKKDLSKGVIVEGVVNGKKIKKPINKLTKTELKSYLKTASKYILDKYFIEEEIKADEQQKEEPTKKETTAKAESKDPT